MVLTWFALMKVVYSTEHVNLGIFPSTGHRMHGNIYNTGYLLASIKNTIMHCFFVLQTFSTSIVFIFSWTFNDPKRNWKQRVLW